jgi:2-polyprenyl-3-methyl-5-hydroxy-6-metoxy-1,4-benzoquinol methylase
MFGWVVDRIESYRIPGRRLLEIGASMGVFLSVAGERGWSATGIEPSVWAVEQGRERFGVDLRRGTVETLEVEPRSVDAVVMLDVLEHLRDPSEALRRIRAGLFDDGLLALSTVNVEGLHGRVRGGAWPWFVRAHLHYFRPSTLSRMLADTGFEIVECTVVPRAFHASYLLQRSSRSAAGAKLAEFARRLGDPKVPAGWMGDVTLILARPR